MFHVQLDESKNVWKEPCTGGLLILGTEGFGVCRLTQSQPQEELSSYTSARHADHKVCCGTWSSIPKNRIAPRTYMPCRYGQQHCGAIRVRTLTPTDAELRKYS